MIWRTNPHPRKNSIPRRRSIGRQPKPERRAAAAVEFALVAPVMLLFVFGLIELGRMMMVHNAATHASREAARLAIRPTTISEEVHQRVEEIMDVYSIDDVTVMITPANFESADSGELVRVDVTVPASSIRWVGSIAGFTVPDLTTSTTMRRESTR